MITRRELTTYLKTYNVNPDALESVLDIPHDIIIDLHKLTAGPGERVYNIHDLTEFKQDHPDLTEFDYLKLGSYLYPYFENHATSFIYHHDENEDESVISLLEDDIPGILIKGQVARLLYDMELIED